MNVSDIANIIIAITSITAICIAIQTYRQQTLQAKRHLGIQILREFEDQFFRSDNTRRLRYLVCKHYKEMGISEKTPPEVWRLADEFGAISFYINKGYVDIEAAWSMIYYWLDIYWFLFNSYIDELKSYAGGVDHLSDFREVHIRLTKYGELERQLPPQSVRYSEFKIMNFIDDELSETFDPQWADFKTEQAQPGGPRWSRDRLFAPLGS